MSLVSGTALSSAWGGVVPLASRLPAHYRTAHLVHSGVVGLRSVPSMTVAAFPRHFATRIAIQLAPPTLVDVSRGISALLPNQWYIWTVLLGAATFGIWAEKTQWGAALSSPLVTMLTTIAMCNLGLLPPISPAYDIINKVLVPLAVPLLLFDADVARVARYAGTLMKCFVLGAVGTIVGTIAAVGLVPLGLGNDGWKIGAALAARHIGGAINFVAVAETLNISANAIVAGLAADNLVVAAYFAFLFWITKAGPAQDEGDGTLPGASGGGANDGGGSGGGSGEKVELASGSLSTVLAVACAICLAGTAVADGIFKGAVSNIPIATLITVAGATSFPSFFGPLGTGAAQCGIVFVQLFMACMGAATSFAAVARSAPTLLAFSAVQIAVHFGFLVGIGRLLRLPFRELALASNANVGGPTTAAAMAAAKRWKTLVLPGLLTGILGYATATFIG
ncbi:unnamed protein product, partial [Phaeothamnion confervicola]